MRSEGMHTMIKGKTFKTELIFCDICGWGDVMIYTDILENNRRMDFCKRHSQEAIVSYIEMNFPPYSMNISVKKDKDLIKKQNELKL